MRYNEIHSGNEIVAWNVLNGYSFGIVLEWIMIDSGL